ncbi:serine hydrolase [Kineosporia sp. NBRC 101731]|nr:serine hydrolase [Kineosporia sp. NBRC 101731]
MTVRELQERLEADLIRLGPAVDVPGASVALMLGSHVVEAAFGVVNTRTRIPVTFDSLFQIQSITKIFTATLVMQLVDVELVHLDRPVQEYLPEFRTADASASEQITVRHLLTHTGGFEGDLWQPTTSGPDALDRFVRDLVARAPQHSRPGQRFSYCNAGFGTLGRLVEVLRDSTYEQALRHHLAEPLGITELAFSADQALAFRTAIGHVRATPSAPLLPTREWALLPPSNPAAGNQLALSARGLLELGRLFVSGGLAADGTRLLSTASAALMLRPWLRHRGVADSHQGLGWRLPRPGVAEHGGGAPGVATMLRIVPEQGLAAVVLTNADAGGQLTRQLLEPLFADLAGTTPAPVVVAPTATARVGDPEPFLGGYSTRQFRFEVTSDDEGRLWLTRESRNETVTMDRLAGVATVVDRREIRPLEHNTFVSMGEDGVAVGTYTFLEPGDNGRFRFLANDRVAARDA